MNKFLIRIFFFYSKMVNKYYQNHKERLKRKHVKVIKILLKKRKKREIKGDKKSKTHGKILAKAETA